MGDKASASMNLNSQTSDDQSEFIHVIPDHEADLCSKLYQQWQESQHCDLIISVIGGELRAHSCIVAAFSPKLKLILKSSSCVLPTSEILIQLTFEIGVVRCLLNMMYSGVLSFSATMLSAVMSTARWLQMDYVVELCKEYKEEIDLCESVLCEVDTTDCFGNDQILLSQTQVKKSGRKKRRSRRFSKMGHKRKSPVNAEVVLVIETQGRNRKHRGEISSKEIMLTGAKVDEKPANESSDDRKTGDPSDANEAQDEIHCVTSSYVAESESVSENPVSKSATTDQKSTKHCKMKLYKKHSETKSTLDTTGSRSKKLSQDQEKNSAVAKELSVMSHSQWVEMQGMSDSNKEEVDFALGKTDHINCKRCLMKFTKLDDYFHHITDHPSFTCDICDATYFRKSNLTRHMRTNHFPHHHLQCKKCEFLTKTEKNLRAHYKEAHDDDKPFACDHPGCSYSSWKFDFLNRHLEIHRKSNLTRHMRTNHFPHHHLQCKKCEFLTKTEKNLRAHYKEAHRDDKPFACDHPGCSYSSWKFDFLNRHLEIHSEVKRYICNKCGHGFAQHAGLMSHQRTCFHLQQFLCDVCGQSFNHVQSMKAHRRTIHFGEKPYLCKLCGNQFSDQRNLKRHMLIHENTFPYKCLICQQNYRHSNSLKAHLKKHGDVSANLNLVGMGQNVRRSSKRKSKSISTGQMIKVNAEKTSCSDIRVENSSTEHACLYSSDSQNTSGNLSANCLDQMAPDYNFKHMPSLGSLTSKPDFHFGANEQRTNSLKFTSNQHTVCPSDLTAVIPVIASESHLPVSENNTFNSPELGVTRVSITKTDKPMKVNYLNGDSLDLSSNALSSSAVIFYPVLSTSNAAASVETVCSIERLAEEKSHNFETGQIPDQEIPQCLHAVDSKSKGQTTYGLQTLAEICFNSSA